MTTATQLVTSSIKRLLTEANFTIHNDIVKSLTDRTVVGFYCLAPSLLRKPTTVKNIQQFIIDNNLPLIVEEGSDRNNGFRVMIIEQPESNPVTNSLIAVIKFNFSLACTYLSMAETCELNIKSGNDSEWWQEKRMECLRMFQALSKAI